MNAFRRAWRDIRAKRWQGVVTIFLTAGTYWLWGPNAAILWFLFLAFLLYDWDNRVIGTFAILSLITCPVLLSFNQSALAETMAVYAYYFLVMTVVLQIVEFKQHPNEYAKD